MRCSLARFALKRRAPLPLALCLGLLAAIPAFAIPSTAPKLRDKEVRVGLLANSYLTRVSETNSDAGTGNIGLLVGVRGVGNQEAFQFGVEAESLYGLRHANYRYLDIGEIYAGVENKTDKERPYVYVGRKRFQWSQLDSYWAMGLYQPRFRWDYLNERENGLLGFFAGYQGDLVQATAYYSPIFIPEQGAPFDITGGNCKSSSPWFSCPSSSIQIFNQATNVNFTLDVPPVKKLIMHAGGGATVRVGREQGFFGRGSYAHKPMNQFLLSFEGRLNVASSTVPAIIRPRVIYHHLFATDLGWQNERHGVTGSAIFERPIRDTTPAIWNTQETSDANLYGLTVRTAPFEASKFTRFEFAYLRRNGGVAPDKGPFVSPGVNYFEPRYAFENAYSFAVYSPVFDRWARSFLFSTKFIVDTANTGNLLVSDVYYSPLASVFLNLGLDMLGSNSSSPVDFLSRYQRNDRIRGGVTYVF